MKHKPQTQKSPRCFRLYDDIEKEMPRRLKQLKPQIKNDNQLVNFALRKLFDSMGELSDNRRYYYKMKGRTDECLEPCLIYGNGIMIGSANCHVDCHSCKESGTGWIICSRIKEATKKGIERYYPKTDGKKCLELCNIYSKDGVMIGSNACKSNICGHHRAHGKLDYKTWIICDKIKEATKKG